MYYRKEKTFVDWMRDIQMPADVDWMILGDFNLMRRQENRNKPGGNLAEMFVFNDTVTSLGLNEIEQQGRKFTWSNLHCLKNLIGSSPIALGHCLALAPQLKL
jgi:hypothetical protein